MVARTLLMPAFFLFPVDFSFFSAIINIKSKASRSSRLGQRWQDCSFTYPFPNTRRNYAQLQVAMCASSPCGLCADLSRPGGGQDSFRGCNSHRRQHSHDLPRADGGGRPYDDDFWTIMIPVILNSGRQQWDTPGASFVGLGFMREFEHNLQ